MAGFTETVEKKVHQQLKSQCVGYLLGSGASYLDGRGYPLASELWDVIRGKLPDRERSEIQAKLDELDIGLEQGLDPVNGARKPRW